MNIPTVNQASDHILGLITTCDKHDANAISTLAEAYRTLNIFSKPIILDCKPACQADYADPGTPAIAPRTPVEQTEDAATEETPAATEETPAETKARRTRRTKEQIAADKAAQEAPVSGSTPEEPAENPETTPETPELPAEEEPAASDEPQDIPALRAEIGQVFAARKIEPGFKACLASFLKAHDSETVVKLADAHIPALLKALKDFKP